MNIRPKNIVYAAKGVLFSTGNEKGKNWRSQIFENYRLHLLDLLTAYGKSNNYGLWLNEMQSRHAKLYKKAGGENNAFDIVAFEDPEVGRYLHDYRGTGRYGFLKINNSDNYDFNLTGIKPNLKTRYTLEGTRTSGDFARDNYNYNPDNLYSSITDDRRLLGRKGDWNENSEEFKLWQKDLNSRGWETYLDADNYYKLRRLSNNTKISGNIESQPSFSPLPFPETELPQANSKKILLDLKIKLGTPKQIVQHIPEGTKKYGFDWGKIKSGVLNILSNPNLYSTGRLIGQLINNDRIYEEALKGILPTLRLTYNTHRQIVGDEATKQAYYRRAALGETKAGRAITSDLDRLLAYQMEAKRVGDELRALGDLADNKEIQRTSDESNQHQWANTLRATEVANANIASINQANSLRHNLLAQKHAANWSSIDNFLQGIEYRKRQQLAEDLRLDDYLFSLNLESYKFDPEYLRARKEYDDVLEKHKKADGTYDYNNQEVIDARVKWANYQKALEIQRVKDLRDYRRTRNLAYYAKSGTKIKTTIKKKDDLLYKSAKDVVEHFRKMSKLASDALNRKKPKIEKLASHPKGSTRKYLLGGLAPFGVYKPAALGGEATTTSENSTSSTSKSKKESEDSDVLDMIKNLFKEVAGKGLSSDVNDLYVSMRSFLSRALAFGEEISTEDLASMYLSQMKKLNDIQNYKAIHDTAVTKATANDAMNEYAITEDGLLVCLNKEGHLVYAKDYNDAVKKEIVPIRNSLLSALRNFSFAGRADLDAIIANGIGMPKIAAYLKANLPSLGTSEIEGYTKKESNDIKAGLRLLLEGAPEGTYKYTEKSNQDLIKAATTFLMSILQPNMLAVIKNRAQAQGIPEGTLIASLVGAHITDIKKVEAMTGKAAKDSDSVDKIKSNPLLAMQREIGGTPVNYSIITRDSNTKLSVDGTGYPALNKVKDDMSIEQMLSTSEIDLIISSKSGITFGDLQINPEDLKDIMYSNTGRNAVVTLPCKIVNGTKLVNLAVIQEYEKAEQEALKVAERGTEEFLRVLGQKLKDAHLDSLLTSDGKPNKNMFSQFLIVEGYATDKIAFDNKKSLYIEKISHLDSNLESRINKALSTDSKNSNYKIDVKDKFALFELTYNDVYRGTVFIPINNNPASALLNESLNVLLSTDLEELYLISNKSSKYIKDNSY